EAVTLPPVLSIEHLLPQKFVLGDYPYASQMPLKDEEAPERCRSRVMHTIGNLTLLTQSLNTAISNGPFDAKRAAIAEQSDLRLNAWLRAGTHATWCETDIVARGTKLLEYAVTTWWRPADTRKRVSGNGAQGITHFRDRLAALFESGALKENE